MPHTIEIEVHEFGELSEKAKEKARDSWRNDGGLDYEWWDMSFQDFFQIANILGIEINSRNQNCRNISTGKEWVDTSPVIYFSGFSCQGDGACFEGSYSYARMAHKKIREYAPKDEKLHEIADELLKTQKKAAYSISASIENNGRYCHEYGMTINVECDGRYSQEVFDEIEEEITEIMRDFARWMYRMLEKQYNYLTSDEQVDDMIIANEYLFTSNGDRSVIL